jgi:hypothetical protein
MDHDLRKLKPLQITLRSQYLSVGKIYRNFDTYAPSETIPPQIEKWLQDYGIGNIPNLV